MKKEKAKSWTIAEGEKALREGDIKARIDIATRFPIFATATLEEIVAGVSLMSVRKWEIRERKRLLATPVDGTNEVDKKEQLDTLDEVTDMKIGKEAKEEKVEETEEVEDIDFEEVAVEETEEPEETDKTEEVEEVEVEEKESEGMSDEDMDDFFNDNE